MLIKIFFEFTPFLLNLQNVVKIEFISLQAKGGVYLEVLQPDVFLQVDGPITGEAYKRKVTVFPVLSIIAVDRTVSLT